MTFLSREQCRAARGLLGWTQQDLATHTGLSKTAINNFERGLGNPKSDTLKVIQHALGQEGLVFLSDDGLKRRKENLFILHGNQALNGIFDDIIKHKNSLCDVVFISPDTTTDESDVFKNGIKRLQHHNIAIEIVPAQNRCESLTSFCYDFRLAFYYTTPPFGFIIESPHAQRAEKRRLQNHQNALK